MTVHLFTAALMFAALLAVVLDSLIPDRIRKYKPKKEDQMDKKEAGTLCLSIEEGGDTVEIVVDGEVISISVSRARHGKASLRINAPQKFQINRKKRQRSTPQSGPSVVA